MPTKTYSTLLFQAVILADAALAQSANRRLQQGVMDQEPKSFAVDQCVWLDPFGVSGTVSVMPKDATWVNDFLIIEEAWTHGLDVRAIDYCTIRQNEFHSMQLILGQSDVKNDKEIRLLKHGGDGGACKQWVLKDHDYITKVQYQFN